MGNDGDTEYGDDFTDVCGTYGKTVRDPMKNGDVSPTPGQ